MYLLRGFSLYYNGFEQVYFSFLWRSRRFWAIFLSLTTFGIKKWLKNVSNVTKKKSIMLKSIIVRLISRSRYINSYYAHALWLYRITELIVVESGKQSLTVSKLLGFVARSEIWLTSVKVFSFDFLYSAVTRISLYCPINDKSVRI